jgi:hypothetical protein
MYFITSITSKELVTTVVTTVCDGQSRETGIHKTGYSTLKSSKVKIKLKDATNVRLHITFAPKLNALSIKPADNKLVHLPCC